MKEFSSAVEDIEAEDSLEARIVARMEKDEISREEAEALEQPSIEFMLDGRVMHAYQPLDGQLTFMLAALGRGQTADAKFAAIINVMTACLREDDRNYLENRLLSRGKDRLSVKKIEEIFEFLSEEWFARPTKQP